MARLIQRIGPIHLKARKVPVFQSLVRAIIYQQLSGKAAETILGRFLGLFGDGKRKMPEPEQLERFGQRWKPYRTLAARYLWRAVDGPL